MHGRFRLCLPLAGLWLAGCLDPTVLLGPPDDAPPEVDVTFRTLHAMLPLSGDLQDLGQAWLHAAELGLAEVEMAGGLRDDRDVTLRWHDTAFEPDRAAAAAAAMLDAPPPHVIVGPMSSAEILALQGAAGAGAALNAGELAIVSPTASSPELDGDRGVLRLVGDVTLYAERLAEFSTGIDGIVRPCKQALVFSESSLFNQRTADGFKRRFEALEGELLVDSTFAQGASTLELQGLGLAAAIAMESATADDGVCLAVFGPPQQAAILIDDVRLRPTADVLTMVVVGELSVANAVTGTPEVPILTLSPTHARGDRFAHLDALWDEVTYGPLPSFAPMVFDAAVLGALALGGTPDGAAIDETLIALSSGGQVFDVRSVAATSDALGGGGDVDYEGVSGSVDLDTATGAAASPLAVLREIGQGWEEVDVLDAR